MLHTYFGWMSQNIESKCTVSCKHLLFGICFWWDFPGLFTEGSVTIFQDYSFFLVDFNENQNDLTGCLAMSWKYEDISLLIHILWYDAGIPRRQWHIPVPIPIVLLQNYFSPTAHFGSLWESAWGCMWALFSGSEWFKRELKFSALLWGAWGALTPALCSDVWVPVQINQDTSLPASLDFTGFRFGFGERVWFFFLPLWGNWKLKLPPLSYNGLI